MWLLQAPRMDLHHPRPPRSTCPATPSPLAQVSVQYTGGRGAPGAPPFGGKEGVMDLLVTENVFYGRDSQVGFS